MDVSLLLLLIYWIKCIFHCKTKVKIDKLNTSNWLNRLSQLTDPPPFPSGLYSVKNNPRQPRFRIKWAPWQDKSNGMRFHQSRTYSSPVQQLQVEKVEFLTLFVSFLGHFVSYLGLLGVIVGLKMSVLTRRIEWYVFPSIWNLFNACRAVTSWKSRILDTSRVFLGDWGVLGGWWGGSYWVLKWASWGDESNGMRFHQFRTYSSPVEQLQVEKVEFWTLLESFLGPWGVLGGSWRGYIAS